MTANQHRYYIGTVSVLLIIFFVRSFNSATNEEAGYFVLFISLPLGVILAFWWGISRIVEYIIENKIQGVSVSMKRSGKLKAQTLLEAWLSFTLLIALYFLIAMFGHQ